MSRSTSISMNEASPAASVRPLSSSTSDTARVVRSSQVAAQTAGPTAQCLRGSSTTSVAATDAATRTLPRLM